MPLGNYFGNKRKGSSRTSVKKASFSSKDWGSQPPPKTPKGMVEVDEAGPFDIKPKIKLIPSKPEPRRK